MPISELDQEELAYRQHLAETVLQTFASISPDDELAMLASLTHFSKLAEQRKLTTLQCMALLSTSVAHLAMQTFPNAEGYADFREFLDFVAVACEWATCARHDAVTKNSAVRVH